MKALLLLFALIGQAPTVQTVPVGELATLTANNATAPLNWTVYQLVPVKAYSNGSTFVFTRPPGTYLVRLEAANGPATWKVEFVGPEGPTPTPQPVPITPTPAPIPQPVPVVPPVAPTPQPTVDPSGFIIPPGMGPGTQPSPSPNVGPAPTSPGFSQSIATAMRGSTDAARYSVLYRSCALAMEMGEKYNLSQLATVAQADQLVGSVVTLNAYPQAASIAKAEHDRRIVGSTFDSATRSAYIGYLNDLVAGLDEARKPGKR